MIVDDLRAVLVCSVDLAAEALGVSRNTAYTAIASGQFPVPVVRVSSRRIVVPTRPLLALLEQEEAAAVGDGSSLIPVGTTDQRFRRGE